MWGFDEFTLIKLHPKVYLERVLTFLKPSIFDRALYTPLTSDTDSYSYLAIVAIVFTWRATL